MKEHKFFERYLNNDLDLLSKELKVRYDWIEKAKVGNVTPVGDKEYWLESNSLSTVKWRQYNVFQFHIDGVYNLYKNLAELVKEACIYYDISFEEQKYMVQGWFNINTAKNGKLDWHDHGEPYAPNFHGYYCVNAEPSVTHYRVFDKEVENINKNNRMIVSEMGHQHAMGDWDWDGSRITIAYDIMPLHKLPNLPDMEQHWIPLI